MTKPARFYWNIYKHPKVRAPFCGNPHASEEEADAAAAMEMEDEPETKRIKLVHGLRVLSAQTVKTFA